MKENKGYLARVEFDGEAGIFHGEVVNLRDVVTFQGRTVSQLRKAFRDSVDDYRAFCCERGEPPEKPSSAPKAGIAGARARMLLWLQPFPPQ